MVGEAGMPILEHRRTYAAGSSLAITLPPGWLRYFRIKAGDEVGVAAEDVFTVRPLKQAQSPEHEARPELAATGSLSLPVPGT